MAITTEQHPRIIDFDPTEAREADQALRRHGGVTASRLADALQALLADPGGDTAADIARIEQLRQRLERDQDPVVIEDFGAGKATDTRTAAEMDAGRTVTKTVGQAAQASKAYTWALLLHHLVLQTRPKACLELGTCLGVSSAYITTALERNGDGGRLVTLEGATALAELSRRNLRELGLEDVEVRTGRFKDTLGAALADYAPIDFAFIDGHHDEAATIEYYEQIKPHLSANAVLVFDDIAWSPGMARAWAAIAADASVRLTADFGVIGVCALGAPEESRLAVSVKPRRAAAGRLERVRRRLRRYVPNRAG